MIRLWIETVARNEELVILTLLYLPQKQLGKSSVWIYSKLDWTLHQKVIVRRKAAWKKHKLRRHFNLSLLENGSVIELKLFLTFTNVFPIGTYLMILNKFVSRSGKHRRIFILWSSSTAKSYPCFFKRICFMSIYVYLMNINT